MNDATFLVIDENMDLAASIAELLEAEGARVSQLGTIEFGLDAARAQPFDVALVDARLVGKAGQDVIDELRGLGDGAEVVCMAGNAALKDAIEAVGRGACAYVYKPLDPVALVVEVRRALRLVEHSRDSKALRRAFERSEAGIGALFDTVDSLLLTLDGEGGVVRANQAAAEAVGVSVEDLVGAPWFDTFVHEDDRDEALRKHHELLVSNEPSSVRYRVLRSLAGGGLEATPVRFRAAAVSDNGKDSLVYVSGEIVPRAREQGRAERLTEKLAAVGTLSAGLAHEIRNPLNAAGLQLRLLNRRLQAMDADAQLLEPVALVQAELGRLSRLVGEFLQFARPTGLVRSKVDVGELARAVVDLEAPAALEKGARIVARLPPSPAIVEGDSEKLRQVVLNLIRNAVEASGKDGRVEVGVKVGEAQGSEAPRASDGPPDPKAEPGGLKIFVSDDGEGIPEQDLSRIFEPFYSTKPGGTGLGMSIVHSLVNLHGGDVSVLSREGEGTRVVISLPAVAP